MKDNYWGICLYYLSLYASISAFVKRLLLIMDGVEIEYRTDEHGEREDDDKAADDAVDDLYAVHVELCTYFINQPCQAVPP